MKHARQDYDRIQDPAVDHPAMLKQGATAIARDEPVFLLRAQDKTAAATVRFWADLQELLGGDRNAIALARKQAVIMDNWTPRKLADV